MLENSELDKKLALGQKIASLRLELDKGIVEKLTKISILADIPLAEKGVDGEKALVVRENTNNSMEEAFRGLRTNLRFILEGDEKVILCTSCIPGEGKTFVCTNLAMSLALMGKKVGDIVEAQVPAGTLRLRIESINDS